MQRVQWDLPPRKGGSTRIYIMSDWHVGHVGCHKKLIKKHLKVIEQDADCHLFLLGDLIDSIPLSDKRARISQIDPEMLSACRDDTINQQIEWVVDALRPVSHKIRLMLIGNHEETILERASADPLRVVARELGLEAASKQCVVGSVYDGAYCASVRMRWPETQVSTNYHPHWWSVDIVLHHGAGGGRKPGAKVNRVDDRGGWYPTAQIVASGHNHCRTMHERVGIAHTKREFIAYEAVQWCFNTGSYLRTYLENVHGSHYAERADYPPSALGGVFVDVSLIRENTKSNTGLERKLLLRGGFL